jgi:hypothetical protein
MGTNYYTLRGTHIGKRSAAGYYCYDCKQTLCKGGEDLVHNGVVGWYEKCPKCNQPIKTETLKTSTTGRELGLNKHSYKEKKGVHTCSSFTWAISKFRFSKLLFIKDEYGRLFTRKEFLNILKECPIQYNNIGRNFS